MTVDLDHYRRAQDQFDEVLAKVGPDQWDSPSACTEWTVRDVAGHVIWGQEQTRHWATGQDYDCRTGAPGSPHPGQLAADDPVETWRAARSRCDPALTAEALERRVLLPALGEIPLTALVPLLVTDLLAHAWDIGDPLGLDVRVDSDLIPGSLAWARQNVIRMPGFFGPELTPPDDADAQTRWLAFLGRSARTEA